MEDHKEKGEKNKENIDQPPLKQESLEDLKKSLEKEIEQDISEFKNENAKVEKIEESTRLSNPQIVKDVEKELDIYETLKNLDSDAEKLKDKVGKELAVPVEKTLTYDLKKNIETILNAEFNLKNLEQEQKGLDGKQHEMALDQYQMRAKLLEIEILKAKGEIFSNKQGLTDDQIEYYKGARKSEKILSAASDQERETFRLRDDLVKGIDLVSAKMKAAGYDFEALDNLKRSDDPKEQATVEEFEKYIESLNISDNYERLIKSNPNVLLDSIRDISIPEFQKTIFDECLSNERVSTRKLIDAAFSEVITRQNKNEVLSDLEHRLSKDKQEALKKLPVEDILASWEKDPPKIHGWTNTDMFAQKLAARLDELSKNGNSEEINRMVNMIDGLDAGDHVPSFTEMSPDWLKKLNINKRDALGILTKTISPESFKHYLDWSNYFVPFNLVPDALPQEEKEKYYNRVFYKEDLNIADIKEYSRLVNKSITDVAKENPVAMSAIFKSKDTRGKILATLESEYSIEKDPDQYQKFVRMKNMAESFLVTDGRHELPPAIFETLERFENQYGNKGRDLIALAISVHGIENPQNFVYEMKSIEQVLNRYNPETIPDGAKVSMGIEYEVTHAIADPYQGKTLLNYKSDISMVSDSANIAKGKDAVHEIALRPDYNPYMLMAQMKLLQEGDFLDFNRIEYPDARPGYHLSLVGDDGLIVNQNMYFLNNVMTMAQLTGIVAGKNIKTTKNIHSKDFENFTDKKQKGVRCEMKGMSTDSVEQFEKALITAHHAGIAIQLAQSHIGTRTYDLTEIPSTAEAFEEMLIKKNMLLDPFKSDQERDIVYEWEKLKTGTIDAIYQHNKSFVDSEFNGFVINKDGDYVDTSEHINVVRNKGLVDSETLKSNEFKNRTYLNPSDLFGNQEVGFVNALTNINNIFLKPPQGDDNSPINGKAALDNVKGENYSGLIEGSAEESVFQTGGRYRDGYYYFQGASEEMITHKSQIILNQFNKNMEKLLEKKGAWRKVEQEKSVTA